MTDSWIKIFGNLKRNLKCSKAWLRLDIVTRDVAIWIMLSF